MISAQGTFRNLCRQFHLSQWGKDATSTWWVETKEVSNRPTVSRASHTVVENSWFRGFFGIGMLGNLLFSKETFHSSFDFWSGMNSDRVWTGSNHHKNLSFGAAFARWRSKQTLLIASVAKKMPSSKCAQRQWILNKASYLYWLLP